WRGFFKDQSPIDSASGACCLRGGPRRQSAHFVLAINQGTRGPIDIRRRGQLRTHQVRVGVSTEGSYSRIIPNARFRNDYGAFWQQSAEGFRAGQINAVVVQIPVVDAK